MLDVYKETRAAIFGENAIRYLPTRHGPYAECFTMHWHDRMELLHITSGSLDIKLNDTQTTLYPGTVAIIGPRTMHSGFAGEDGVRYNAVIFETEKFCNKSDASVKYLAPLADKNNCFIPFTDHPEIVNTFARLSASISDKKYNSLYSMGILYELIALLYEYCFIDSEEIATSNVKMKRIIEYVNQHFCEPLTTKGLSQQFNYNETYLCRSFREITGLSILKYIRILRLEKAMRILSSNTQESIGDIAWQCGFSDISYFSKCFRKQYGFSPTDYKRERQEF